MTRRFRTALVGVGRIGASYANDPLTAAHYRYATHAQVLANHPAFEWGAAVDTDQAALAEARARWGFPHSATSVEALMATYRPEILVLATPPSVRAAAVTPCVGLKAVICEKPLGVSLDAAREFLGLCDERGLLVQVNFWRRCDAVARDLAAGGLGARIGRAQAAHGLYGNGLLNNGSHMVDFCRMLFGEVVEARVLAPLRQSKRLPLAEDFDVAFMMKFTDGLVATVQPLDFQYYREVGLDIWGTTGRLEILNEGLVTQLFQRAPNRALAGAHEIRSDVPERVDSTVGEALYQLYDNLAAALEGRGQLQSPGASALRTAIIVDAVRRAALAGDDSNLVLGDDAIASA